MVLPKTPIINHVARLSVVRASRQTETLPSGGYSKGLEITFQKKLRAETDLSLCKVNSLLHRYIPSK